MERSLIHPPLSISFDDVYEKISKQTRAQTPELRTTGGVPFVAEAKHSRDGRRFISLPHNNRVYEGDWGYNSNSMGKAGQRIGQYSKPIDDWAKKVGIDTNEKDGFQAPEIYRLEVRMPYNERLIEIRSRDYWFKIVEFLQQNWALIDETPGGCTVFFFGDTSGVFDRLTFPSVTKAKYALRRNGFARFAADKNAQEFIAIPQPPFHESQHPNGPIYSSGRFWR